MSWIYEDRQPKAYSDVSILLWRVDFLLTVREIRGKIIRLQETKFLSSYYYQYLNDSKDSDVEVPFSWLSADTREK